MLKPANRPFLIAGIIALIVTVLFFINRHYDIHESLKESIIEAWSTSMAAIFTALTVYLLYRQNLQQLDDRKAASKPDIYPAEANLFTKDETINEVHGYGLEQMPRKKLLFQPYKSGDEGNDFTMFVPISVHNIGLGAAKNVKYKWEYDEQEVYNFVQGAYFLTPPTARGNTIAHSMDFIAANNSIILFIPYYFCTCFGISVEPNNAEGFHKTLPALGLQLDYLDIHDNHFQKRFQVSHSRVFEFVDIKFFER